MYDELIEKHVKYRMGKWYDAPVIECNIEDALNQQNRPLHFLKINRSTGQLVIKPCRECQNWNGTGHTASFMYRLSKYMIETEGCIVSGADNVAHKKDRDITSCIFTHNRLLGGNETILFPLQIPHVSSFNAQDDVEFYDKKDDIFWRGSTTGSIFDKDVGFMTFYGALMGLRHNWHQFQPEFEAEFGISVEDILMKFDRYRFVKKFQNKFDFKFHQTTWKHEKISEIFEGLVGDFVNHEVQLQYKYILNLDGNDCSSGLGYFLNYNSLILSPVPKWNNVLNFNLTPWKHYVPIDSSGDDLEEKLDWCRSHQSDCNEIVTNASTYMKQFNDNNESCIWTRLFEIYNEKLIL